MQAGNLKLSCNRVATGEHFIMLPDARRIRQVPAQDFVAQQLRQLATL
jgi:hypothetical protein